MRVVLGVVGAVHARGEAGGAVAGPGRGARDQDRVVHLTDMFARKRVGRARSPRLAPKPILAQVGLEGTADLQVKDGVIEIRPVRRNPREGWADDARRVAEHGDDSLVWPEFANEGDDALTW